MEMTMPSINTSIFDQVIAGLYSRGLDLEKMQVPKNNSLRTGIHVKGMNVSPTVYQDQVEHYANSNGIPDTIDYFESILTSETPVFDINKIVSKEYILDHVMPCVVQKEGNEEFLSNLVSADFLDLAIYYRITMDAPFENENETASASVKHEMLSMAGISQDELHEAAVKNLHPVIYNMCDLLREMTGSKEFVFPDGSCPMLVVTNETKWQGAGILIKPEVFKDISDRLESDLFILPSSIHELIVVPCGQFDFDTEDLRNMVRSINAEQVEPEDQLSDSVYRYSRERNAVELC
jgi:hypothetical protein